MDINTHSSKTMKIKFFRFWMAHRNESDIYSLFDEFDWHIAFSSIIIIIVAILMSWCQFVARSYISFSLNRITKMNIEYYKSLVLFFFFKHSQSCFYLYHITIDSKYVISVSTIAIFDIETYQWLSFLFFFVFSCNITYSLFLFPHKYVMFARHSAIYDFKLKYCYSLFFLLLVIHSLVRILRVSFQFIFCRFTCHNSLLDLKHYSIVLFSRHSYIFTALISSLSFRYFPLGFCFWYIHNIFLLKKIGSQDACKKKICLFSVMW